jgi:acetyl esterase/lipase
MHAQAALLLNLAHRGWIVVCCAYGKGSWPVHIDDCLDALLWVREGADRLGIDTRRVVLSGASAGGHIATLLALRLLEGPRDKQEEEYALPAGLVLFYPALDVWDESRSTATFPFSVPHPLLDIRRGQSLLSWFFQWGVLRGKEFLWHSANPFPLLREEDSAPYRDPRKVLRRDPGGDGEGEGGIGSEGGSICSRWPSSLIVHGELDSLVPVEHSKHFLRTLGGGVRAAGIKSGGEGWRQEDVLVEVPGARHSFEISVGAAVDACNKGVIGWLQRYLEQ